VSGVDLQGPGSGLVTYSYSYSDSGSTAAPGDYNVWNRRTTETLPDGNQQFVYTNASGEVMLSAFREVASGKIWPNYYRFDAGGRLVLNANPSAVVSFNETLYQDLVNYNAGTFTGLSANSGLIAGWDYSSSSGADNYLYETWIANGYAGAKVLQSTVTY